MALYTNKSATSGSGSGAPTDAQYWVAAADGTLSAEKDVSALVANGALIKNSSGSPAAAVADTDYEAATAVATQSLGSAAQNMSITVVGNTDEGLVIVGSGKADVGGTITIGFNDEAETPTYTGISSSNGGAPSAISTFLVATYVGPLYFTLEIDARVHDSSFRTGVCRAVVNDNGTNRDLNIVAFRWPNSTGEITTILLKGSAAAFFASGYKLKTRRRKVT